MMIMVMYFMMMQEFLCEITYLRGNIARNWCFMNFLFFYNFLPIL